MNINDILGIGKILPVEKLISLVEKAFGRVFKGKFDKIDANNEGYRLKNLAEIEAYKIKLIGKAKQELEIEGKQAEIEFLERTQQRLLNKELKKQLNIENIIALTEENLSGEEAITDEDVNEDWVNRFFNIASEISDKDIQKIWAKILSEEIKKPNSYSFRTLDVLRNLSKQEATIFLKVAKLKIKTEDYFFILSEGNLDFFKSFNLKFKDISLLEEIGLLEAGRFTVLEIIDDINHFKVGNFVLEARKKKNHIYKTTPAIPIKLFTKVGEELLNLVTDIPDFKYLEIIGQNIIMANMTIKYAEYDDKGSGIKYKGDLKPLFKGIEKQ